MSLQSIHADGEITFTVSTGQTLAVGLSLFNTGRSQTDLDHSIRFSESTASIWWIGATQTVSLGTYTPTTKFTIRRNSDLQIQFLVNGQLRHTRPAQVVGRLQADCSLNNPTDRITGESWSGKWRQLVIESGETTKIEIWNGSTWIVEPFT